MADLRAVIFDLDGVIVDSEPNHFEAFNQALAPYGITLNFDYFTCRMIGVSPRESLARLRRDFGLSFDVNSVARSKDRFYEAIATINPRPNILIIDLVHWLTRYFPLALASGAPRENISVILRILNLAGAFQSTVSGDEAGQGKPDPEIFLLAAEKLCIPPEACIVVEDSAPGLEAAHRAGMRAIAIRSQYTAEPYLFRPTFVIEDIKSIDVARVGTLLIEGQL